MAYVFIGFIGLSLYFRYNSRKNKWELEYMLGKKDIDKKISKIEKDYLGSSELYK